MAAAPAASCLAARVQR